MATYEFIMKPQGKTLGEYMIDRNRVSIIIGPLGSGKTIQTCQKIFDLMCDQAPDELGVRKTRWYAVRNTYSDLLSTTTKDWLGIYGDLGTFKLGNKEPPCHKLNFKLDDGTEIISEMIFIAFDRDAHVKKIRGSQLTGVWLSETKELNKSIVDMLDLRHGRYPRSPTWHGMLGDTNAPDQDHWLYKLAEETKPVGWKFFKQPGGVIRKGKDALGKAQFIQNPDAENLNNLPNEYYMTGMQGKTDDWIAVNLANEYGFVSDGKAVFDEYNDNLHCKEFEFIDGIEIFRGWDFGVPACVLAQYTPKGRLVIKKEFTSNQTMGIDRFSDHVLNECAHLRAKGFEFIDVGDPAGDSASIQKDEVTCFSILREKGIDILPGKQDLTSRLEGVRFFLGRLIEGNPAFILHPDCKMLRKGFSGGYAYKRLQVAGEKYTNKPEKNMYSHPMDCVQYICTFIRSGYHSSSFEEDEETRNYDKKGRSNVGGY